jgi:hypothetical protein
MRFRASALGLVAVLAAAHDYPVTYGVLTVGKGKAAFRLRLTQHHVQPELEAFAGRRLALKDADVFEPALLEAYFKDRVALLDSRGRSLPWRVVKQELDAFDLVVTLEATLTSVAGARLRNVLFFDRNPAQQNLVTVEGLGPRKGLTFDARHPVLRLGGAAP